MSTRAANANACFFEVSLAEEGEDRIVEMVNVESHGSNCARS